MQTAFPNVTVPQINAIAKDLGDNPTVADLEKARERVNKQADFNITRSQAQATADEQRIAKGEKPVIGVDQNNHQVLVPAGDANKYGLTQVREVGQAENEKVSNARGLMTVFSNDDPEDLGLIELAQKLAGKSELGPVASRLQDWLNKGGSVATFDAAGDPDVQRLFTKLGLSTTGLMQVHVGARGSAALLEHFADLANAKQMSADAFIAALDTENKYIRMKAMLPPAGKPTTKTGKTGSTTPATTPAGTKPPIVFNPESLPKAN
jgi:hypothetical protein